MAPFWPVAVLDSAGFFIGVNMRYLILCLLCLNVSATELLNGANCFIDGSNTPRCFEYVNGVAKPSDDGVAWPVYTNDTPEKVWAESNRRWNQEVANDKTGLPISNILPIQSKPPLVRRLKIDVRRNAPSKTAYPDIICLDFINDYGPAGSTCFDTMQVTER